MSAGAQAKPLWYEGVFLTPNHFQQWDRWHAHNLRRLARTVQPFAHGFARLELDREALGAERLALVDACGVLPDGAGFDAPHVDALPAPRDLAGVGDSMTVWVAAPSVRAGVPTVAALERASTAPARYRRDTVLVRDEVDGGTERDVVVAVPDLRLLLDSDDRDGFTALPIARITRAASGGFTVAEDFAAPTLAYGAAPLLTRILKRLVDICASRASDLAGQRRQRTQGMVEFSVSESANFLLLQTLNGALPGLMHLLANPTLHPERLYGELARLAGALFTFAGEGTPRELPPYRHDEPTATFAALDATLRKLLETNITSRYTALPLTRSAGGVHGTRMPEAVLAGHRLYLSVQSSAPVDKIVTQTPAKAKIAASARVPQLIAQAMKGMALSYLSVPPGEIAAQPGCSYFELQRNGDEWDTVVETRSMAIFLPPDFTDLRLEFMAVKE